MAWIYLVIAGLLEIAWAFGLKSTDGFSRLWPSVWTIVLMLLSFVFLSLAMKNLPLGTAYAIWTGIGTIGAVVVGMIVFHEPATAVRIVCIVLIVAGMVGLRLTTAAGSTTAT